MDLAGGGEPPVEQPAGVLVDGPVTLHERHDQGAVALPRGADQGVPGLGGVAVLDPDDGRAAVVAVEEPVAVPHALRLAALAGPGGLGYAHVPAEVLPRHAGAAEQRQVVRGGQLAGLVQPAGVHDRGVVCLQAVRLLLHEPDGLRHAARAPREHVRGVVAGDHHHRTEQVVRPVPLAWDHARPAADDRGVLGGRGARLLRVQPGEQRVRGQDLQRARRRQPHVRASRGEDLPAVQVGHDERLGLDRRQRRRLRIHDQPTAGQFRPPDGAAGRLRDRRRLSGRWRRLGVRRRGGHRGQPAGERERPRDSTKGSRKDSTQISPSTHGDPERNPRGILGT